MKVGRRSSAFVAVPFAPEQGERLRLCGSFVAHAKPSVPAVQPKAVSPGEGEPNANNQGSSGGPKKTGAGQSLAPVSSRPAQPPPFTLLALARHR